ncbi:MAG: pyridoxamine 5'-phosphate oxidase [Gammaproteobacteria bacterium]|nr:pyridoxamine 5'-phosphate oxidase [Gammaproteobacteria bacterium]
MSADPRNFTLEQVLADCWQRLNDGVTDRKSPFHTPSVATVTAAGTPSCRTVVLRACDSAGRRLRFHTDRRSAKVDELARAPALALHVYDPAAKLQLRISGEAGLHYDDEEADAAWAAARAMSRECYRVEPGPGTPIASPGQADGVTLEPDTARGNFVVVWVQLTCFEWLYLAGAGHRRARFRWDEGMPHGEWLVP